MARYTGPTDRLSRRAGVNLFLKGERSLGPKNPMTRRNTIPGQHGTARRPAKVSEYGKQLREKQKAKAIYGILERQFHRYYKAAANATADTSERLLQLLELRLDNLVYRLGFADSRSQARQYVTHGHIKVNGKKLNIPSAQLKSGDTIELTHIERKPSSVEVPVWMKRNGTTLAGELLEVPSRDAIPTELEEKLIVEFYSR